MRTKQGSRNVNHFSVRLLCCERVPQKIVQRHISQFDITQPLRVRTHNRDCKQNIKQPVTRPTTLSNRLHLFNTTSAQRSSHHLADGKSERSMCRHRMQKNEIKIRVCIFYIKTQQHVIKKTHVIFTHQTMSEVAVRCSHHGKHTKTQCTRSAINGFAHCGRHAKMGDIKGMPDTEEIKQRIREFVIRTRLRKYPGIRRNRRRRVSTDDEEDEPITTTTDEDDTHQPESSPSTQSNTIQLPVSRSIRFV